MFIRSLKRVGSWVLGLALVSASLSAEGRDLRLIEAVKKQNAEAVRALLTQKVNVNHGERGSRAASDDFGRRDGAYHLRSDR